MQAGVTCSTPFQSRAATGLSPVRQSTRKAPLLKAG